MQSLNIGGSEEPLSRRWLASAPPPPAFAPPAPGRTEPSPATPDPGGRVVRRRAARWSTSHFLDNEPAGKPSVGGGAETREETPMKRSVKSRFAARASFGALLALGFGCTGKIGLPGAA